MGSLASDLKIAWRLQSTRPNLVPALKEGVGGNVVGGPEHGTRLRRVSHRHLRREVVSEAAAKLLWPEDDAWNQSPRVALREE